MSRGEGRAAEDAGVTVEHHHFQRHRRIVQRRSCHLPGVGGDQVAKSHVAGKGKGFGGGVGAADTGGQIWRGAGVLGQLGEGIEIDEMTWGQIAATGQSLGVAALATALR